MTGAEQTRLDAIEECASALDHAALYQDDDYAAAPYLRCADLCRQLGARQSTKLSEDFLASHDLEAGEMRVIDDMNEHCWWSVQHWLQHWHHLRFR